MPYTKPRLPDGVLQNRIVIAFSGIFITLVGLWWLYQSLHFNSNVIGIAVSLGLMVFGLFAFVASVRREEELWQQETDKEP